MIKRNIRSIKAFTLIELLVVIAIIGSLASILFPNFMAARERTRDTQRKSDLNQIQKAFELYRLDQSPPSFPDALPSAGQCFSAGDNCTGNIYMNKFPTDPLSSSQYYYTVDNSNLTYTLCACLENTADADAITDLCGFCAGCTAGPCYLVNQP